MNSRFLVGVILLTSGALSLAKTPAAKKVSRNEWKEKNVEVALEIQEEMNMLQKDLAVLQESLLMEARDITHQTKGSLLVAGSVTELEEACNEKKAICADLKNIRGMVQRHTKNVQKRLVKAGKENSAQ